MSEASEKTLLGVAADVGRWVRTNLVQVAVLTLLGVAAGYAYNVYQMAVLGGFNDVQKGMTFIGRGNERIGALWIAMITTLVFSMVSYAWTVGPRRFGRDLIALPSDLARLAGSDTKQAASHILWGIAVALIARQLVGPRVGVLIAASLLIYLPSVYGQVLVRLALRATYALARLIRPGGTLRGAGGAAVVVGAMGSIGALWLASYIAPSLLLILALACGAGAFMLGRGGDATAGGCLRGGARSYSPPAGECPRRLGRRWRTE